MRAVGRSTRQAESAQAKILGWCLIAAVTLCRRRSRVVCVFVPQTVILPDGFGPNRLMKTEGRHREPAPANSLRPMPSSRRSKRQMIDQQPSASPSTPNTTRRSPKFARGSPPAFDSDGGRSSPHVPDHFPARARGCAWVSRSRCIADSMGDGLAYEKVALNLITTGSFGSLDDNAVTVPCKGCDRLCVCSRSAKAFCAAAGVGVDGCVSLVAGVSAGPRLVILWSADGGHGAGDLSYYIYISAMFEYPQTVSFSDALCFLGLVKFDASARLKTLLGAGLCLGLGVLSVPTVMLALPLIALWVGSRVYPRPSRSWRWRSLCSAH